MPNDALVAALESMRDAYGQRQRAATSLLAALRGTTGALGKAGRLINEYADGASTVDAARLAQARRAFAELRLRDEAVDPLLPELRREVKALQGVSTALREALAAVRGEAVDVVGLDRAYTALRNARLLDEELAALLPQLHVELEQGQRALGSTFGQALRLALAAQGIEVGGVTPRYAIGRFELVADFPRRTAALYYGKDLVVSRVSLGVEAVVKAYGRAAEAVTGRNEDGERWIQLFYEAWQTARRRRDRPTPRVNIVDCYLDLVLLRQGRAFRSEPAKSRFTDYSRAYFAYDFNQFVQRQRRDYKGWRAHGHAATKDQTGSSERSMWIVEGSSPYDGHYIGDVDFSHDT